MRIIIPRQNLMDVVSKVKTVVSAKSALPILSHILLEADESSLKLSATDLKVSIECKVDCTVEEPGSFTVSSQRLASILAELPDMDISLDLGENSIVTLVCGRIETKLFSMAPDEFPPIPTFEGVEAITFEQGTLKKLFNKTSFAICTDQARYNLTGLLFEMKEGNITTVATDGRRLCLCRDESGKEGIDRTVVIPGKMIIELERLLGDDEKVNLYLSETQAAFEFEDVRLVTGLIEGKFPDYDMVVPKTHDKEVLINVAQFTEAIRRTRTMTSDKFNSARFTIEEKIMTLKVVTPEVGEYVEQINVEYEGDNVEVAFNPDFVLDVLKRIDVEMVSLILKDSMNPGMFKPYTDAPVDNYINVIMPIRI